MRLLCVVFGVLVFVFAVCRQLFLFASGCFIGCFTCGELTLAVCLVNSVVIYIS